jgi:hypothetical protein
MVVACLCLCMVLCRYVGSVHAYFQYSICMVVACICLCMVLRTYVGSVHACFQCKHGRCLLNAYVSAKFCVCRFCAGMFPVYAWSLHAYVPAWFCVCMDGSSPAWFFECTAQLMHGIHGSVYECFRVSMLLLLHGSTSAWFCLC